MQGNPFKQIQNSSAINTRILVINSQLDCFLQPLFEDLNEEKHPTRDRKKSLTEELFEKEGSGSPELDKVTSIRYQIDSAANSTEGYQKTLQALEAGRPYAIVFVDMREDGGWNRFKEVEQLWSVDPWLQVIVCIDATNSTWDAVIDRIHYSDQLIILVEPYDRLSVKQITKAMVRKRQYAIEVRLKQIELESTVQARTHELASTRDVLLEANRALISAKKEAEKATKVKSEFLATMSHELRTPMNAVLGMAQLLEETELNAEQREFVETITLAGESLLGIINNVLDYSRIEAQKISFEMIPFSLRSCLEDIADMLAPRAQRKGLDFILDFEQGLTDQVVGDQGRIRQIVSNLVDNSIKFTHQGSITVRVFAYMESKKRIGVQINVIDTGIGISSEYQEKLFQSFSQFDSSSTRAYDGAGLGLAISKQLVESMGGQISLESELGKGSTFTCLLEMSKQSGSIMSCLPKGQHVARALIVDPSPTHACLLNRQLIEMGAQAECLVSLTEACDFLARIPSGHFSLGFVRYPLSQESDFEKLDQLLVKHHLKIVFITTYPDRAAAESQVGRFASGFLTRPIKYRSLKETFSRLMKKGSNLERDQKPINNSSTRPDCLQARILIVEDNPTNQTVALRIVEKAGYICHLVDTGKKAVQEVTNAQWDLVLMDCQLPEMSGYEATKKIRELEVESKRLIPIIAMTANALIGERERCIEAGMNDYIAKPINKKQLCSMIEKYLKVFRGVKRVA